MVIIRNFSYYLDNYRFRFCNQQPNRLSENFQIPVYDIYHVLFNLTQL